MLKSHHTVTGHLNNPADAGYETIHGPLVLFDCSNQDLTDIGIGCVVNVGCYVNNGKGDQSCAVYCSNHPVECQAKGWETVGQARTRDLASALGTSVFVSDGDLGDSTGKIGGTSEHAHSSRPRVTRRLVTNMKLCQRMRRQLKIREPMDSAFWERPDFAGCWSSAYQLGLYADSHLAFAAFPLDASCPIVAVDAGLSEEDLELPQAGLPVLHKMISIVHPESALKGVLFFDHEMPLHEFAHAVANARVDRNEDLVGAQGRKDVNGNYDILINNCATFILDMANALGLQYKKKDTYNMIINYVGERLAANPHVTESIFEKLEEQNGIWVIKFMTLMRGKEHMIKEVVRKYVESENQQQYESSPM